MAATIDYHDRVLAMAERLVREHPQGQELLELILSGEPPEAGLSGPGDTLEIVFTGRWLSADPEG